MADEAKKNRVTKLYNEIKDLVINMDPHVKKSEQGNKAAGGRVRKSAQIIRKLTVELRKETLLFHKQ
jgi:hypothetical protein